MFPMLPTVLRNLFSPSATRLYPFEKREPLAEVRGRVRLNIAECVYCGACSRVCPSACISVDKKENRVELNAFACVYCGVCVEACTTGCMEMKPEWNPPSFAKNTEVLQGEPKSKEEIQQLTKRRKSS